MTLVKNESGKIGVTSRRDFLKTGGKYAALVPVSTVLVSKSARAGGSSASYMFPNGYIATNELECTTGAAQAYPGAANRTARIAARRDCRRFLRNN